MSTHKRGCFFHAQKRSENMATYNKNIDYAAEIEKEFQKDRPSYGTIAELALKRDQKIKGEGIQTQSTQDFINDLLNKYQGGGSSKPRKPRTQEAQLLTMAEVMEEPIDPTQQYKDMLRDQQQEYKDMIDDMLRAQRQSRYAQLDKARDSALANLDEQEAGIKPRYYDAQNRVGAQADIGQMNFAQYMASKGIKGSQGGYPEIYRNAALQGQLGALGRQEQAAYDQIARARTGIQNAYEADRAAAAADIDAQGLQAYINQMNADRAFELQLAGLTGIYNGTPTLAAQQFELNKALQEAGLTGQYNGQPTFDYQKWLADNEYREKPLTKM